MKSSKLDHFDADIARFVAPRPAPKGFRRFIKVIAEPGLTFVWLMRVQLRLEQKTRMRRARVVHLLNLRVTGGEVGHGCVIGPGLVVKHPLGVVIGGGTAIGRNCTILHNVTFGELRPGAVGSAPAYPQVDHDVLIGNGAALLGSIRVGHGATIGAGAVVLRDVPPKQTAVGVPAQLIQRRQPTEGH